MAGGLNQPVWIVGPAGSKSGPAGNIVSECCKMDVNVKKKTADRSPLVTVSAQMTVSERARIRKNSRRNGRSVSAEIRHRLAEAYSGDGVGRGCHGSRKNS